MFISVDICRIRLADLIIDGLLVTEIEGQGYEHDGKTA